MSQFYTAGPHFFHTSVAHECGFASGDAFVDHWCEQYEKQVKRDSDIVYILGDLAIGKRSFMDACDVLDGLPDRKVLVYGNHDACSPIHSHWSKAAYDRAQKTFMRCAVDERESHVWEAVFHEAGSRRIGAVDDAIREVAHHQSVVGELTCNERVATVIFVMSFCSCPWV